MSNQASNQVSDPTTLPAFPIDEIAVVPAPGMRIPRAFAFSHDEQLLTYLLAEGTSPEQALFALDVQTGAVMRVAEPPGGGVREEALSLEGELRRQRQRTLWVGITEYALAERSDRILIPVAGSIYVQGGPTAPLRLVLDAATHAPAQTPVFSPDADRIAYVAEGEVNVIPEEGGEPRQVTHGAREHGKTNGLAEFMAQEELDRQQGFWWAPDGKRIAFEEVDATHIPVYRIMHQGKDETGPAAQEDHAYPFAGHANAAVRLGVVPAVGGDVLWMDLDTGEEHYLARVFWWKDGRLGAVLLNRPQTSADVVAFDPASGTRTTILRETDPYWITLTTHHLHELASGQLLWLSERSGFRHVYLCSPQGEIMRQLTTGEWMVDALAGVDEERGLVYVTGTRETPTESHLYAVPLAGGPPRRLTSEPGMHDVTLDHGARRFVDVRSTLTAPPTVTLRSLEDGAPVLWTVPTPDDPRVARFALEPPAIVTLANRHGTPLCGAVYRPPARYGPGPYPTIVQVYGGPHVQMVQNSWALTAALQMQYLRQLGFLIFRLDNRGSARRGMAFESPIHRHMGTIETEDQVDGVRWLIAQGLADPTRIGATGWSGGGYMTLRLMEVAPELFRVGVAGAPVTHQDGYDTTYTERYMGTPQENSEGYRDGSVLAHVDRISGKLLLVHGLLDENVHFRHTARLINALIRARKPYDLLIFPDERHMLRREAARSYLNERVIGYFVDTLLR
jgi:dipeptidyl-peptidase 4